MNRDTSTSYWALALLIASGAITFSAAQAQTPGGKPAEELEEVTVTGSRVITNGNDSPTPVTVVTMEDIQATRPTTIFEGLLDMPAFAGSRGVTTNPGTAGGRNNNISALSLRGLGQQRTLVLYDGHRVPPTQEDGFVNINMIPQMLLQRVDVVTGGGSAVYGSDAITGVVNFVTDRKFNGLKATAQYGISQLRDGKATELGVAGGMDLFGGRGHLEGSLQQHDDKGVDLKTSRLYGQQRWTLQGSGTAALPNFLVPYATNSALTFGGKITQPATCNAVCLSNPYLNQQFIAPGVLGPFNNGSTVGVTGTIQIGGDGAYDTSTGLKAKLAFQQIYGRFDFDISDNLHYYLTTSGTVEHSFVNNTDNSLSNVTISSTNAFLPGTYQTQLTSRSIQSFTFGKMWNLANGVGPATADDYTRQWLVNTGLEGKLGQYRWEAWFTHGVAKQDNRNNNAIDNGHLSAALDATQVTAANVGSTGLAVGSTVCNVALTNPGLYPGCVPINVFGVGSESADAVRYVTTRAEFRPTTKMDNFAASISGSPFNDWAGPVNMALSGEYRKLDYELRSNSLPVIFDPLSCTGLRFNCTNFNASAGTGTAKVATSVANRPPVSQRVAEAALEADIPLLKDLPFLRAVNLNAAGRYARYSDTGSPVITAPSVTKSFGANTWKVGLDWKIVDALRLRATRSRDFRAPTLVDLYSPASITSNNMVDLLTTFVPVNGQIQSSGNPDVQPEVGYTTTVGFVVKPKDNLSFSIDAYDITVRGAIVNANGMGPDAQNNCYNAVKSGGTSFYCSLQVRPVTIEEAVRNPIQANTITMYLSAPVNVADQKTWGVDTEANWNTQIRGRNFTLRGLLNYQPHSLVVVPSAPVQDYAGVDFSNSNQGGGVWRGTVFLRYNLSERLLVDWSTRYRSPLHHTSNETTIIGRGDPNFIPSVMYSNLNLSYNMGQRSWGQTTLYMNVQNLFNDQSYPTASAGPQGRPGNFGGYPPGDDPIGRYYSIGVRYRR